MIQNPFFLERRSIYVTLPFSFHVFIMTRLCSEGLGGFGGFSGGVKASGGQSSEDPKEAAMEKTVDIVHSPYRTFTMHDLDVTVYYELTTSFNPSSRVWRSFSTAMTSSDVCKEFLRTKDRGINGPQRFYSKFGEFSSCVSCWILNVWCLLEKE